MKERSVEVQYTVYSQLQRHWRNIPLSKQDLGLVKWKIVSKSDWEKLFRMVDQLGKNAWQKTRSGKLGGLWCQSYKTQLHTRILWSICPLRSRVFPLPFSRFTWFCWQVYGHPTSDYTLLKKMFLPLSGVNSINTQGGTRPHETLFLNRMLTDPILFRYWVQIILAIMSSRVQQPGQCSIISWLPLAPTFLLPLLWMCCQSWALDSHLFLARAS